MPRYKNKTSSTAVIIFLCLLFSLSLTATAQEASLVVDFSQGANENPTQGDVVWIRGILLQSNSTYYEGMSTLQRIAFLRIPKTTDHVHTLTFSHLANKGADNHAYDFITSWSQAVQAGTEIGGPTMLVNLNECGPAIGPPANLDEICDFLHASGYISTPDCPDNMGSLLGDDVAAIVANYEAHFGNRTVNIYGNTPISAASMSFAGYDAFLTGVDTYADYALTWTSSSDSIIIELAGHLAVGIDPLVAGIGYGEGRGSGDISGGPYHFKLYQLDGASLGNQDNQIQGADILFPPPVCSVTPESDEVCVGGSAIFEVEILGGTAPYTVEWTKPPEITVLSTDSTLIISDATTADAGQYQVVLTDDNGLAGTCYAELLVYAPPICSLACPDPPPECQSPGNMMIASTEGDIVECAWSLTGDNWNIEEDRGDTIIYSAGTGSCTFNLVVTDVRGCQDSSEVICDCEELVPVTLTDFQAVGGSGVVVINWATASEVNCQSWEVYRGDREDGEYTKIATLSGHGSTEITHTYRWVDRQVRPWAAYFYKLKQIDFDGSLWWSRAVSATAGSEVPTAFGLRQNFPNPFNASTQIYYQIPHDGQVVLKIYNIVGEEVRTLAEGDKAANSYVVLWDGRDHAGAEVSSGLYFCRLKAGDFSRTIRMVLLR
ncbi:immunoglobulin domain-containing protein [Candidatus Zixiibacteriota bacterium]